MRCCVCEECGGEDKAGTTQWKGHWKSRHLVVSIHRGRKLCAEVCVCVRSAGERMRLEPHSGRDTGNQDTWWCPSTEDANSVQRRCVCMRRCMCVCEHGKRMRLEPRSGRGAGGIHL